jgi:DNA repair protein RadC
MTYEIMTVRKVRLRVTVKNPGDIYTLVKRYAKAKKEQFIVITLNGINEPISVNIASIGILNRTIVHPREVFYKAILDLAASIIICHNHPNGSAMPSDEDVNITTRIYKCGKILGINVLDHLIITKSGFCSMRQEGYFEDRNPEEKILCDTCADHTQCAENTKPCPYPDYPIREHKL